MKKTEWFPGDVKPVYVGVYWTRRPGWGEDYVEYPAKWTGKCWAIDCATLERAAEVETESEYQDRQWLGLAEPPHDL